MFSNAKVETLCANSLAEVGVAVGDFVDALEASRFSQDISTAVYQQLVALDDFLTFKKLMVSTRCYVHAIEYVALLEYVERKDRLAIKSAPGSCQVLCNSRLATLFATPLKRLR